jgi:hypothetical protein
MTLIIANVYNSTTGTWQNQPADISYSANIAGTGTIKVFTTNNAVIGSGTVFSTQLGHNYVIRNSANVYVGKIANITSNTAATLRSNAVVAINGAAFNYQTYTANVITYDPNSGNGNISIFSANNSVIGINTTFTTQLDIGYQIFDNKSGNLLGVIQSIHSNTRAYFTTPAVQNQTTIPYYFYNPVTQNTPNSFPKNMDIIHNHLLNWSRSGLIPGVTQVKSYHPPMPDPVTGVLVNFPATVHTSNTNRKSLINANLAPIDTQSHVDTNSTTGTVRDFDAQNGIVGSSVKSAINSVPLNTVIKKLATTNNVSDDEYNSTLNSAIKSVYGNPVIPNPPGLVVANVPPGFSAITNSLLNSPYIAYQGPGANVVYVLNTSVINNAHNTAADQLALAGNFPPIPRVTDNRNDANTYYSITNPVDSLTEAQRADLAARASNQFSTDAPKRVTITGVPAAVPGLLNVTLSDENPVNRQYVNPTYDFAFAPTIPTFNRDLPISPQNPFPTPVVIAPKPAQSKGTPP